jgi:hypothetical protein
MSIKATLTFLKENFGINKKKNEKGKKKSLLLQLNYIHTINMFHEDL